jgi:hypothetical protein
LIDYLIEHGRDESKVRKAVLVVGMLFGLAVFAATQTANPAWAIFWISIALGGLASAAPVGWSLPSLIAPKGGVGTIGGVMNFANNLDGRSRTHRHRLYRRRNQFVCQCVLRRRGDPHRRNHRLCHYPLQN